MIKSDSEYRFRYESNLVEIVEIVRRKKPRFIAIDGRDGSGKTYLSRNMNIALGGTRLTEADYRWSDKEGRFNVNIDFINDELSKAEFAPIVFDCCFMQELIPGLILQPDLIIYAKSLDTNTGYWSEGDELYSDEKESSTFRQQMKDYHKKYHPDKKANLTYENRLAVA
jgi:hypothetical protein